jgi:putative membrane protein
MKILVCLIAAEHLFILWIEMFAWTKKGEKFFPQLDADFFEKTKGMAANQGLYNGFLAAGLIWSATIGTAVWAYAIATFFLCCVIIAGVYGALTSSRSIFFKQALPAIIVLIILMITK